MHILLIEPDKKLASTYVQALRAEGYGVDWATTAQGAVHLSDAQKPDLVILELQLSGHNGIEFIYEFRSYTEWQDIPIMLLTMSPPHALQITQTTLDDFAIVACLYKPATSLKQLIRAVGDLV